MIIDYIPGQALDRNTLLTATSEQRKRLFKDIIQIMSELSQLEFLTAGSLLASANDVSLPVIGSTLSIPANELQRYGKGHENAGPFFTATQFIAHQHYVLSETYRLPAADQSLESVMSELFALDSISKHMPEFIDMQ